MKTDILCSQVAFPTWRLWDPMADLWELIDLSYENMVCVGLACQRSWKYSVMWLSLRTALLFRNEPCSQLSCFSVLVLSRRSPSFASPAVLREVREVILLACGHLCSP